MRRTLPALVTAVALAFPAAGSWAAVEAPKTAPQKRTIVTVKRYAGPAVDMRWGPVQVTAKIKITTTITGTRKKVARKLTDTVATYPTERERSAYINEQAVPILRTEALQAQSAHIDLVSGATMTSEAYAQSLQAALQAGRLT